MITLVANGYDTFCVESSLAVPRIDQDNMVVPVMRQVYSHVLDYLVCFFAVSLLYSAFAMANEDTTIPEAPTNEESKISTDDGEEEESQVMSTMSTSTILGTK